jgi:hypothetical protein
MLTLRRIDSLRRAADEDKLHQGNLGWFQQMTPEDRELVMEQVGPTFRLKITQLEIKRRLSSAPVVGDNNFSG